MVSGEPTLVRTEDVSLVRAAKAGQRERLDEFVERMGCIPRILAAKNARLGHPLHADELADLSQEAFAVVWDRALSFSGRARLETWVARICLLTIMNAMRRKQRRPHRSLQSDLSEKSPSHDLTSQETVRRVDQALSQLEPVTARIIRARLHQEHPFDSIAADVELPVNTVKTRYYRGMERLRRLLGSLDPEEAR